MALLSIPPWHNHPGLTLLDEEERLPLLPLGHRGHVDHDRESDVGDIDGPDDIGFDSLSLFIVNDNILSQTQQF